MSTLSLVNKWTLLRHVSVEMYAGKVTSSFGWKMCQAIVKKVAAIKKMRVGAGVGGGLMLGYENYLHDFVGGYETSLEMYWKCIWGVLFLKNFFPAQPWWAAILRRGRGREGDHQKWGLNAKFTRAANPPYIPTIFEILCWGGMVKPEACTVKVTIF